MSRNGCSLISIMSKGKQQKCFWKPIVSGIFLVVALNLAGCNESILSNNSVWTSPDQSARGLGPDDLKVPQNPNRGGVYGPGSVGSRPAGVVYPGSPPTTSPEEFSGDATGTVVEAPNGAYQLNFENADVASVCKVIFGDLLKTNYIVDPRVAGQISLTSSVPIPRARLVPLLESALLAVSASVVKENGLYRIAPTMDPGGLRRADYQTPGEGYGVTVIGSKYISAASIAHLLEEYGSRAGSVKMDPAANFVIVQGTGAERQAALETASMVDVDWLRLKSVAILPLSNSQPEQVITEINHILGTGEGGFSQDMVQMQPIARLNAVLAIARTRQLLDKVVLWAKRLDKQDYSSLSIKTYHLQYAQAKTVAGVLNDMFGGEGSRSASGQSDKDQLQPTSSPGTSSNSGSSPYSLSSQIGAATGSTASSGTGQSAGNTSSGGASSNPFGALKNTFATADDNKTNSSGSGAPSSTSNANRVHVTADVASNTLFIYANRQVYDSIERAIRDLDRAPTQVNIEVTIAEVTLTDDLQYGVQAYLNSGKVAGALTNTTTSLPLTTVNPAVNLLVGSVANPRVAISALSSVTNVKVLSSPSLVVSDRQVATLQIGDQVPILTQQATSTITAGAPVVNSVSYQDTGIILNVLPRVNANSVVSLEIEQQISAVSSTDPTTLTPTISQRRVHSSVSVPSGQTVLLAGLIQDKRSGTRDGIPGIASIKFLNDILTTHDTNVQRDELIIFIRPQIIRNSYDAQQVTEEFRSRLQSMQPQLIESHHRE